MKTLERPKFVYIARKSCGCVAGVATDLGDKQTGKCVAEFIGSGLTVNRVSFDEYRSSISNEETFMACPHKQAQKTRTQLELFV